MYCCRPCLFWVANYRYTCLFFAFQKYIRVYTLSLVSWSLEYLPLCTLFCHHPTFEPKRYDLIIPKGPDLSLALPGAICTFDLGADIQLRHRDLNTHDPISCFGLRLRPSVAFIDNKLYGLESFLQLLIIPIAHPNQLLAILLIELCCLMVTWG